MPAGADAGAEAATDAGAEAGAEPGDEEFAEASRRSKRIPGTQSAHAIQIARRTCGVLDVPIGSFIENRVLSHERCS